MKINFVTSGLDKVLENLLCLKKIFAIDLFIIITDSISIVCLDSISSEFFDKKSFIDASLCNFFISLETQDGSHLMVLDDLSNINLIKRIRSQDNVVR